MLCPIPRSESPRPPLRAGFTRGVYPPCGTLAVARRAHPVHNPPFSVHDPKNANPRSHNKLNPGNFS